MLRRGPRGVCEFLLTDRQGSVIHFSWHFPGLCQSVPTPLPGDRSVDYCMFTAEMLAHRWGHYRIPEQEDLKGDNLVSSSGDNGRSVSCIAF